MRPTFKAWADNDDLLDRSGYVDFEDEHHLWAIRAIRMYIAYSLFHFKCHISFFIIFCKKTWADFSLYMKTRTYLFVINLDFTWCYKFVSYGGKHVNPICPAPDCERLTSRAYIPPTM